MGAVHMSPFYYSLVISKVTKRDKKNGKYASKVVSGIKGDCTGINSLQEKVCSGAETGNQSYLCLKSPFTKCPQVIFMAEAIGSASNIPQNPNISPRAMTIIMVTSGFRFIDSLKTSGFMT